MAITIIDKYHGEPAIIVDGKPIPPMAITICRYDSGYLKRLGEAGIRIFYVQVRMRWNTPETVDENGNVYAAKTGSATITVTVTDEYGNKVTDTCDVNAQYTWWQWIIVIVLFGWIWY